MGGVSPRVCEWMGLWHKNPPWLEEQSYSENPEDTELMKS